METNLESTRSDKIEKLVSDLKAVAQDGEQLLKASARHLKERADVGLEQTRGYVREHPYQSMGVVLGAGVIVGLLLASMIGRDSDSHGS